MSPDSDFAGIADASRPNAGRIYDYLLGGNHNFEIDRQAAERLLDIAPEFRPVARLIRWFLGEAVRRLLDQGFRMFLDFASGLPTVDHIHQIAPKGTKVIYSDLDPVTVAYAQELIKDVPDVAFVECNISEPERLLGSDVINEIFGNEKKIAMGMNGIAWFMTDEGIEHTLATLFDWAASGTRLFISDVDTKRITEATEKVFAYYQNVGQPVYPRTQARLVELAGKWRLDENGFRPLNEWLDIAKIPDFDKYAKTMGGFFIGGILIKE
jgi:O-methyltransferase involved in polyketide biosynthesis